MIKAKSPIIVLNGNALDYDLQSLTVSHGHLIGDVVTKDGGTYSFCASPSQYSLERHESNAYKIVINTLDYGLEYRSIPVSESVN